jgi:hypothetical protein
MLDAAKAVAQMEALERSLHDWRVRASTAESKLDGHKEMPCIYCGGTYDDIKPGPCPGSREALSDCVAQLGAENEKLEMRMKELDLMAVICGACENTHLLRECTILHGEPICKTCKAKAPTNKTPPRL